MASIRSPRNPSGIRYDMRFRVNGIPRTRTFLTMRTQEPSARRWKVKNSRDLSTTLNVGSGSSANLPRSGYANDW